MSDKARDACPDRDKHTNDPTEPSGYVAWHEWASWMAKRSKQKQCPTCGLWVIWAPTGEELGYDESTEPVCLDLTGSGRGRGRKAGRHA
jgi:hypothetical protein